MMIDWNEYHKEIGAKYQCPGKDRDVRFDSVANHLLQ